MTQRFHDMQACLDARIACDPTRLSTATHHRLERGGRHIEPAPLHLATACAKIGREMGAAQ